IKRCGLKSKLVLQIHDELIFDVFEDEKDEMIRIIKEGMKNAMKLNVTLDSSLSVAYSWYDAK
ncbi:MAG: DNA polymerase, partial [Erysipelotrichaceae bacterium]